MEIIPVLYNLIQDGDHELSIFEATLGLTQLCAKGES